MTVSLSGFVNTQAAPTSSLSSSTASGTSGDIASGQSSLNTSYQSFLTLLTTQLQNQDPTSPEDPSQFTTELAQLTGVQQQILSNQLLQQLVTGSPSNSVSSAVNLIGKQVTATSASANLTNGVANWSYSLPSAASTASVTVTNSAGVVVYTGNAPGLSAGSTPFTWNGQNSSGVQQPDGTYSLSVAAADSSGGAITPTISVSGTASSIQSVNGTTLVTLGSTQVPASAITNVSGS